MLFQLSIIIGGVIRLFEGSRARDSIMYYKRTNRSVSDGEKRGSTFTLQSVTIYMILSS